MKTSTIILALAAISMTYIMVDRYTDNSDIMQKYSMYLAEQGKTYNDAHEFEFRFKIFSENFKMIEAHNAGDHSYTMGLNQFSDITNEEYRKMLGRYGEDPIPVKCDGADFRGKATKDVVDWVKDGAVNAVQNQGSCGSCWAFGTVGAIEGAHFIATGELLKFSEQQFVDCCHAGYNQGCNGGFQNDAFKWAEKNPLCLDSDYTKYHAAEGTCTSDKCSKKYEPLTACHSVVSYDVDSLKAALEKEPVSVTIDAGSAAFQNYASGILDSSSCGIGLNHAVLGVGFGTNFVTIKNSWGSGWGDNGYIHITDSQTTRKEGICGIFMDNAFADGQ
jgi:KDEL-tailed cysteine endopeptidase